MATDRLEVSVSYFPSQNKLNVVFPSSPPVSLWCTSAAEITRRLWTTKPRHQIGTSGFFSMAQPELENQVLSTPSKLRYTGDWMVLALTSIDSHGRFERSLTSGAFIHCQLPVIKCNDVSFIIQFSIMAEDCGAGRNTSRTSVLKMYSTISYKPFLTTVSHVQKCRKNMHTRLFLLKGTQMASCKRWHAKNEKTR